MDNGISHQAGRGSVSWHQADVNYCLWPGRMRGTDLLHAGVKCCGLVWRVLAFTG
jgi:hypothetical protein